nr:phosphonate metabolism protein/1,5-bisphosphokinase (PRPP-forming) PhnN [uncultured Rhizobium sp.]
MDGCPANSDSGKSGVIVVVVGPSGAGKDTLMAEAARHFANRDDVVFARRTITRDPAAGGEDHDGVSEDEFAALEKAGRFAVSWNAHGLSYGIPKDTLDAVEGGSLVIANGSRSALAHFHSAYPAMLVINVIASRDVLAARLEARGRECREDILRRLERGSLTVDGDYSVVTIDNSGSLSEAAQTLIDTLERRLFRRV